MVEGADRVKEIVRKYEPEKKVKQMYRTNKFDGGVSNCGDYLVRFFGVVEEKRLCLEMLQEYKVVCVKKEKVAVSEGSDQTINQENVVILEGTDKKESQYLSITTIIVLIVVGVLILLLPIFWYYAPDTLKVSITFLNILFFVLHTLCLCILSLCLYKVMLLILSKIFISYTFINSL